MFSLIHSQDQVPLLKGYMYLKKIVNLLQSSQDCFSRQAAIRAQDSGSWWSFSFFHASRIHNLLSKAASCCQTMTMHHHGKWCWTDRFEFITFKQNIVLKLFN